MSRRKHIFTEKIFINFTFICFEKGIPVSYLCILSEYSPPTSKLFSFPFQLFYQKNIYSIKTLPTKNHSGKTKKKKSFWNNFLIILCNKF